MLPETALADAYSIPFEFVDDTPDRVNDLSRFYQHPTYADMIPVHYTDDTQRSIANARMVLRYRSGDRDGIFNPIAYVAEYQATFASDPRAGYSRRFEAFLKQHMASSPTDMALATVRKPTNGSVMGAAVLGFLPDVNTVMLAAAAQALSTHSYAAIPFAQMVALSAFYTINQVGPLHDLTPWLLTKLHESGKSARDFLLDAMEQEERPEKTTMGASSPVKLMLWALPRHSSLSSLMKLAVDVGGDTDSAAAVMVAVASESKSYISDLPENLWNSLENDTWGRDYLIEMDRKLHS